MIIIYNYNRKNSSKSSQILQDLGFIDFIAWFHHVPPWTILDLD